MASESLLLWPSCNIRNFLKVPKYKANYLWICQTQDNFKEIGKQYGGNLSLPHLGVVFRNKHELHRWWKHWLWLRIGMKTSIFGWFSPKRWFWSRKHGLWIPALEWEFLQIHAHLLGSGPDVEIRVHMSKYGLLTVPVCYNLESSALCVRIGCALAFFSFQVVVWSDKINLCVYFLSLSIYKQIFKKIKVTRHLFARLKLKHVRYL